MQQFPYCFGFSFYPGTDKELKYNWEMYHFSHILHLMVTRELTTCWIQQGFSIWQSLLAGFDPESLGTL